MIDLTSYVEPPFRSAPDAAFTFTKRIHATGALLVLSCLLAAGGIGRVSAQDQASCTNFPAGAVAWWPADGFVDSVVGNHPGILRGGASFGESETSNPCFRLDGIDDYVEVADSSAWTLGTNDFTLHMWVRYCSAPESTMTFMASSSGPGWMNKWIFWHSAGSLSLHVSGDVGNPEIQGPEFSPETNEWYYIALTRSGARFTFFINGSEIGASDDSRPLPDASAPLTVGGADGSSFFQGDIDEPAIFLRALSSDELTAVYSQGRSGVCKPLWIRTTTPPQGGVAVASNTVVGATFNRPLDGVTVTAESFVVRDEEAVVVPGSVSYDEVTSTCLFRPSEALIEYRRYIASVATDVRDLSGHALSREISWSFVASPSSNVVYWLTGEGDWGTPSNWNTGTVPGPGDDVIVSGVDSSATVTVSQGSNVVRSLFCATPLTVAGGVLSASSTIEIAGQLVLSGGQIQSTILNCVRGGRLVGAAGILDGVTVGGDLDLGAVAGARLLVTNGLTLNGTAWVGNPTNGNYGGLGFEGSQTLGGTGTVVFGGWAHPFRSAVYLTLPETILTLGPGITVRGQSGVVGVGRVPWNGPGNVSVVNQGVIQADVAAGRITLEGIGITNQGTLRAQDEGDLLVENLSNEGSLVAETGTMGIGGTLRGDGLGLVSGAGLRLEGVADNTGRTLLLDNETVLALKGGTIQGGTVLSINGARLSVESGILDGVTVGGDLDLGAVAGARLLVTNGLTLNGTAWVGNPTNGNYGGLGFEGSQTLGGTGTVVLGANLYNAMYMTLPETTLTLGPGITVRGQNGTLGVGGYPWNGPGNVSLVNQGVIQADVAGGRINVSGQTVTNSGVMRVTDGADLVVDNMAPLILQDPHDVLLDAGEDVNLQVRATGQAPLSFQWWHEQDPLADATNAQLTLSETTAAQSGTYRCLVTNALGIAVSSTATVVLTNYILPTGVAGPVIVRVAAPEGSTDSTGTTASQDGVWQVRVPPFPLGTNIGIGHMLSSTPRYFCLHDHFYVSPFVPYPERAVVTYEFNRPATVGIMQLVLHANGISQIEGFAGDTLETLESVGLVTGSKGIPPPVYAAFRERSINTFVFPNPRPGKLFVMVVRRTSFDSGYANYQTSLFAPDGRQYLPAASPRQLVPVITSPKQQGMLVEGDTLFFSAASLAETSASGYRWQFDEQRQSSAQQPGFITFPTTGTNVVTCDLLDSTGQSLENDSRVITIVPNAGSAPDLAVVSCDVPVALSLGTPVTVRYAVTNVGPGDVTGTEWIDSLYLSHDTVLDATDVVVATSVLTTSLPAGYGYTNAMSVTLPTMEEGPYFVILSVDDAWHVLEVHQLNNQYSTPVVVGAATLSANTWIASQVPKPDAFQYYRIEVTEAQPMVIEIESAGGVGMNRLFAKHGSLPNPAAFDYASPGGYAANVTVAIPLARPGTWYILAHSSQKVGDGSYSIRARPVDVQITGVAPAQGVSGQDLTLDVTGVGFTSSAQISLVSSGGAVYHPAATEFISPERLAASFPSNSLPAATYSVVVARTDGSSSTSTTTLAIAASGSPKFEANLVVPGEVGRSTVASLYLEYANRGTAPMAAPLLVLQGSQNAKLTIKPNKVVQDFWTCGQPSDASDSVQIMAEGQTPGFLQPGERVRVPVHYLGLTGGGDLNQNSVQFSVGALRMETRMSDGSPIQPIPWASLKDQMRPTNIMADAWEALWQNFTSEVGTTWADYQRLLFDNASYLAGLGQRSYLQMPRYLGETVTSAPKHSGDLLAFEFAQADGLHIVRFLAASTDGSAPTPGLSLSFERVFPNRITGRHALGALGRGWSHNWETWLEVAADDTVTISGPSGSRRTFKKDCRGGYFNDPGDYATLTALGAGAFSLREKEGLLRAFRSDGRLDYIQDPNNNRITCGYSGAFLTSITHSSGQSLQLTHTGGLISTITDPVGRQTLFTYAGDHLTAVQHFDGSVVRYGYSIGQGIAREHALTEIEYPGGTHQFFGYDARGRLASMSRDGGAEAVSFSFDSEGLVNATDALGNTSKFFLDQNGLLVKTENPQGNSVRLNYDDSFNLTSITDPAGRSHTYGYDSKGNLVDATDSLGGRTHFGYEGPFQRLGMLQDAKGNPTRYSHDAQGNLTAITYANQTVERWAYDSAGSPTVWTNRRGNPIQYQFNAAGQLAGKLYPDGSRASYEYDPRGNLVAASNHTGLITLDYYADDRLRRITYPQERWLEYTFNAAGQRASMTDQLGYRLDYDYDAVGRLRSMTDSDGIRQVLYEYDLAGRLAHKTLGNGVHTTYGYDSAGQLLTLTNAQPVHSILSFFNYTYDSRGRRVAMATHYGTWSYGYDDLGQLTRAVLASTSADVPSQELMYVYDALGNRVRTIENGMTTEYAVNDMNQYSQVGGLQMNYDADGSLTEKLEGAATVLGITNNADNRVTGFGSSSSQREFAYDALGFPCVVVRDGVQYYQVHDPTGLGDLVGVFDTSGGLLERQNHAFGTIATTDGTGQSYLTFDGIGNVCDSTTSDTSMAGTQVFRPFGERIQPGDETLPSLGFGGELGAMKEGDLVYMRSRFYSPMCGRFTSSDTIGILGGINLYAYAGNDPLSHIDPSGQQWQELTIRALLNAGIVQAGVNRLATRFAIVWAPVLNDASKLGSKIAPMLGLPGLPQMPVDLPWMTRWGTMSGQLLQWEKIGEWGGAFGIWAGEGFGNGIYDLIHPDDAGNWVDGLGNPILPDTREIDNKRSQIQRPRDPNNVLGPGGFGPQNFVASGGLLPYRINFENATNASAPAQQVVLGNPLSSNQDWATLELTEIGFGDHLIAVPPDTQHFHSTEKLQVDGFDFEVQIEAGIRLDTGEVYARFQSINPTNSLPPPVNVGFLPPEDSTHRGQGHISYVIRPKTGLPTGTEIRNIATITFDGLETIRTDQVDPHDPAAGYDPNKQALVTIDADVPASSVVAGEGTLPLGGLVSWAGSDMGAGVAGYDVYVSADGGAWRLWQSNTVTTSARFYGDVGNTYAFYSVARDNTGHVEAPPSAPDMSAVLENALVLRASVTGDTLTIHFPSELHRLYRLESKQDVHSGEWATVVTVGDIEGDGNELGIALTVANELSRFYRIVRLASP